MANWLERSRIPNQIKIAKWVPGYYGFLVTGTIVNIHSSMNVNLGYVYIAYESDAQKKDLSYVGWMQVEHK